MEHTHPFRIDISPIHGNGLFANRLIKAGEVLSMSPIYDRVITNGSLFAGFNHACDNNAIMQPFECTETNSNLEIIRDIQTDEEITLSYYLQGEIECQCPTCRIVIPTTHI